jgi:hypothetical protein
MRPRSVAATLATVLVVGALILVLYQCFRPLP